MAVTVGIQVMDEWEVVFPWNGKKSQVFWIGGCNDARRELMHSAWNSVSTRSYFDIKTIGYCGNEAGISDDLRESFRKSSR